MCLVIVILNLVVANPCPYPMQNPNETHLKLDFSRMKDALNEAFAVADVAKRLRLALGGAAELSEDCP